MKTKIALVKAQEISAAILAKLEPYTTKCVSAGSTRRKKGMVGDIEIVAMPKARRPIDFYAHILNATPLNHGEKYMKFELQNGIQLDLFFVFDEMQWGFILTQRTGPAEFNKWLFTTKTRGGIRPAGLGAFGGYIYLNGEKQDTSTEAKFLACFGLPYIAPESRQLFDETDTPEYKAFIQALGTSDPFHQLLNALVAIFGGDANLKDALRSARLAGKNKAQSAHGFWLGRLA